MQQTVYFEDLGRLPYQAAWDYQTSIHKILVDNKLAHRGEPGGSYEQAHRLIFVEHPHVYTLGKSGSIDHLLLTEAEMQARGIEYFPINRGGDITYHGPGQLVGYPILDLECFFCDVHRYVRSLEAVIIGTLAAYGIEGTRVDQYTGVWLPPTDAQPQWRKICAIGVHLSRWTTLHGWAFNVNTDLSYFDHIIPCGIEEADKTVTSLAKELGHPVDFEAIKQVVRKQFEVVFDCELR